LVGRSNLGNLNSHPDALGQKPLLLTEVRWANHIEKVSRDGIEALLVLSNEGVESLVSLWLLLFMSEWSGKNKVIR